MTHVPKSETRLRGAKIGMSARKLSEARVVHRSNRHKASEIFGIDDAVAWVERLKEATAAALEKKQRREDGS